MVDCEVVIQMMAKILLLLLTAAGIAANASDSNDVFDPCSDANVQKHDAFTFGLALAEKDSFFLDQVQLTPCDTRLALATKDAQLAVFRPKVDEISLLTINSSSFKPGASGGYMVAFAGRKYAARSVPIMVTDNNMIITSFTLVLEFQKGVLQNLYWKKFGCQSCSAEFACLRDQDCALPTSKCSDNGGDTDCNISIQLTFSGIDKNLEALNSWYEVSNLRQYSLYGLYANLRDSILGQFSLQL